MALNYFLGTAAKTPYVNSSLVTGTPTVGGFAVATCNSKTVSYTIVTGDTRQTICTNLIALLGKSTVPGEFKQFTYDSPATDTIRATGPADGAPVTIAFTVTGATVTATTTTQSSPHDLTNVINWSLGSLPVNADTAVFDRDIAVKYNLEGLVLVSCGILRTNTHRSDIGLPEVNPLGFTEYKPTKLKTISTVWNVADNGVGTVRLFPSGTISPTVNVTGPDASVTGREPTVQLFGTGATWTLTTVGGSVSVYEGAAITSWTTSKASIRCPNLLGITTATFNATYGQVALTLATTAQIDGGSVITFLAGSSFSTATATITGASLFWASGSNPDVLILGPNGVFDATLAPSVFTVSTSITIAAGGIINDPYKRIVKPLVIALDECTLADVTLNLGLASNLSVT